MKHLDLIDNSQVSKNDFGGGERIAIELSKRWSKKLSVNVYTSNLGSFMWNKYDLNNVKLIKIIELKEKSNVFSYFNRAIQGIFKFGLKNFDKSGMIYSCSDFWPDSIPAFVAKIKNPKMKWIAGFYLFAPNPWQKDSPYKTSFKRRIIGLAYWLTQLPIYFLVKKYADYVFVTSEPDVKKFITKKRNKSKIIVVQGGVDITESEKYLKLKNIIPIEKRKYDACFVGRFHYQKGVLELIEIWNLVCKEKSNAKLAMIGIGPLKSDLKKKIKDLGLEKNIDLLGFKDGKEKYQIFKQSKIIVHPATYDSGGMAAAEGMAWALPGVSFDLEALKTYYPKGMIKTKCFDKIEFAKNIRGLLNDPQIYKKTSKEAHELIKDVWDWDKRTDFIYKKIIGDKND